MTMSLLYVRHGATQLNGQGSEERLRGWLPAPLSPAGIEDAKKAAAALPKGLKVDSFTTSDLPRAVQTAQILSQAIGKEPEPDPMLRDWNTGRLAGQKVQEVLPLMKALITHSNVPAPDGEPLEGYLARFVPLVKAAVNDKGLHLMVGHARGATVLEGLAHPTGGKGGSINRELLYDKPQIEPGGMMLITPDWNMKISNPSAEKPKAIANGLQGGSLASLGSR